MYMTEDIKKLGTMIKDIKEIILLAATLMILLVVAMGFANSLEKKTGTSEQFFQQLDTDNDGQISREEFPEAPREINEKNK